LQPIDLFYRSARLHPGATAVEARGVKLGYRALAERVDSLAAALQGMAPDVGSRVGVCAHNSLEHLLAILAVMAADKVWVPLNPLDAKADLDAKLRVSRPGLIIADADCLTLVDGVEAPIVIAKNDPGERREEPTIAGLIEDHRGCKPVRSRLAGTCTQALKFTGGSSGVPKGVLQPYRAWIAGAVNMLHAFHFHESDRFLLAAPLTHGTSCYVTPVLAAAGTLVLLGERARPDSVLEAFARHDITATFLPPTLIYMLMNALDGAPQDFKALRLLIYGAAPMPADRILEAQSVFGPVIAGNYGLTEAPQIITALTPGEAEGERLGSAGRAGFSTRVEIVNGDGEILSPGEQGEIVAGGDLLMTGYLDLPGQTAETLKDGWLHTGDLGYMDERGFVYITDRISDMIISGGFNVYPGEVEKALAAHEGVNECVVFGMADPKWGEAVHAAVTLRNGAKATGAELIRFAKGRIGSLKAPKRVHVLGDLPRSSVGKVQRRKVKEIVAENL
jgi:acyl-CoA synthetase (AMP-forming)/AMP-acid ligase II